MLTTTSRFGLLLAGLLLVFGTLTGTPSAEAEDKDSGRPSVQKPTSPMMEFDRLAASAKFFALYPTYSELLEIHRQLGTATEKDIASMTVYLNSVGIRLTDRIVSPTISKSSIRWGSIQISKRPDGGLKNQNGFLISFKSTPSFSETFQLALREVNATSSASILFERVNRVAVSRLVLDRAEAQERMNKIVDGIGAAISLAADGVLNVGYTGVVCPMGALFAPIGGYAQVVRAVIQPAREWIQKGSIECLLDNYVFKNLDLNTLHLGESIADTYQAMAKDKDSFSPNRLAGACMGAFAYGAQSVSSIFVPGLTAKTGGSVLNIDRKIDFVPKAELAKIFGKEEWKLPPCTSENAAKVESVYDDRARAAETTIAQKFASLRGTVDVIKGSLNSSPSVNTGGGTNR